MVAYEYTGYNFIKTFVFDDDKLKKILIRGNNQNPQTDDVYVGKIVNYVKEIDGYFIEFDHYTGFMKSKKKYHQGTYLPIVVTKEERGDKGYRVSDEIYFKGESVIFFPDDFKNRFSKKISLDKQEEILSYFFKYTGFLFRTECENKTLEEIEKEVTEFYSLWDTVRLKVKIKNNKQLIYRNNYQEFAVEKVTDLNKILELEDLLENHLKKEIIFQNRMKASFELTKIGTVIDFDSYQYKGLKKNDHLQMNISLFEYILDEIYIRNLSGVILIDSITINNRKEILQFTEFINKSTYVLGDIRFHDITKLGMIELSRRVVNRSIMEFSDEEILLERLFLRIKYLEEHVNFDSLEIALHPKYYEKNDFIINIQKSFDFSMTFVYNRNVDDYSIKPLMVID